jgi:hypothetical protein
MYASWVLRVLARAFSFGGLVLAATATAGACGGSIADDSLTPGDAGDAGGDVHRLPHHDAAPPQDASDDGGDDGGLPSCMGGSCPSPGDVSGFQPTWKPPTAAHQNVCTPALVDQYYQDCLSVNSPQTCTSFGMGADAAHKACQQCIVSQFTDGQWGPLVYSQNVVDTNSAGCIAVLDPSLTDCAKAVEADMECQHAACDPVCGGGSFSSFDQWVTCTAAANACGCMSYFAAADCVKKIASSNSPARPCLVGQTFADFYYATAAIFCGK